MNELQAMLLSVAIEGPVAYALVVIADWPSRGAGHVALATALATAATHPQLWFAVEHFAALHDYVAVVLAAEAVVVVVEAAIIGWAGGLAARHAFAVSLAANVASGALGMLMVA